MTPSAEPGKEVMDLLLQQGPHLSGRKIRLLSAAIVRERCWSNLPEHHRRLVAYIEKLADCEAAWISGCPPSASSWKKLSHALSPQELEDCERIYAPIWNEPDVLLIVCRRAIRGDFHVYPFEDTLARMAGRSADQLPKGRYGVTVTTAPVDIGIIRCIIGNTEKSVSIDPAWLVWNGGTVAKIAESVYVERSFVNMPILGDALEEAGCLNPEILDHCRRSLHAHGCWLLDVLTGRDKIFSAPSEAYVKEMERLHPTQ